MIILFPQSCRSGEALMRTNWEEFSVSEKRSMLILLTAAHKPFEMTAGKILKVNIEQFRTVFGTAVSYYTLLKNLKENRSKM